MNINAFYDPYKTVVNSVFILATCLLSAQECKQVLMGNIVSMHDNTPLEAAVVQVKETNQHAVSQKDGSFVLNNLCADQITLVISHLNCEKRIEVVDLLSSTPRTFYMDHHVEMLHEVVLQEEKTNTISPTAKVVALSESQRERYGGDGLANAIAQFSGVSTLSTGSGLAKPIIHGMFGSRVGVVYDQTVLENQQWGQDHAPSVDVNAFDNIQVVKGVSTLQYTGDNPGGLIILATTPPMANDSLYGKTIVEGNHNNKGMNLLSSLTKSFESGVYLKAQGTYKNYGDSVAPDYVLSNTALHENNFSLTVGKQSPKSEWKLYASVFKNEVGILRSSHVGSVRDLYQSIALHTPRVILPFSHAINAPKQANNHLTTTLSYRKKTSSNHTWNFQYAWQRNNRKEYDVRRGENKYKPSIDLYLNTHSTQAHYEWTEGIAAFKSGVFAQVQDNTSNPDTGVKRLIPDYIKFKTGGFLTAVVKPNRLMIGFGARYEHSNNEVQKYYKLSRWNAQNYEQSLGKYVTKELYNQRLIRRRIFFHTISFQGGFRYELSNSNDLGFNYSLSQRAPDIAEMFSDGLHHSLATIEYGNPFLSKETNHKLVLDYSKVDGDFQFNISPYLTISNDFIVLEPEGVERTIRGAFPVWEFRAVDASFKGVDIDLSYTPTKGLLLKSNTSWIEANETKSGEPLISIPPLTVKNSLAVSPSRWENFSFEVNTKHVLRQNRYPNHNFETDIVEGGQYIRKTIDISTPPPAYHLLGGHLKWGPYRFLSTKVNLTLSVDNLFDRAYRNYLNRLRYYADEQGRNVRLHIKFSY
jgi:iron complex outermembrane receptor protein